MTNSLTSFRLLIVGPDAPPAGGMAAQTQQLKRLLVGESTPDGVRLHVDFLQTNKSAFITAIDKLPVVRAGFRLLQYLINAWIKLGRADVVHLMSNSGWSWQLYSAPILWLAAVRGVPVIVNYRGGGAGDYFSRSWFWVNNSLRFASAIAVPSAYLSDVFRQYRESCTVIPNIIDLDKFRPAQRPDERECFHIIAVRNLESIYGMDVAIEVISLLAKNHQKIKLSIAGSGPEEERLKALAESRGVADKIRFLGRLNRDQVVELYQTADIFLNCSRVDNMPNSLLEAMACGVPIVTTAAGGIPYLVEDGKTGLMAPVDDKQTLVTAISSLIEKPELRQALIESAQDYVQRFGWSHVKHQWLALYQSVVADNLNRNSSRSWYTQFVSGFVFPIQERVKSHSSVRLRRSLERSQWLSDKEIESLRVEKLRNFLIDIYQNVDYYRALFDQHDFDPHKVKALSDLQHLPLMSKSTIKDNLHQLKANNAKGLSRFSTGGSSGNPLTFFLNQERVSHDVAAKWRATRWWGVDIGDPEMVVWGSPIELGAQDRVRQLRDDLYRTHLFSAFDLSDTTLDKALSQLKQQKPKMVFGYPSVISSIAGHAAVKKIDLSNLGVKVVFVTAERLYPEQRKTIEKVFGCPVANGYGGRDSGFIAHECPEGNLHISAEDIIVEIVDDEGLACAPGEQGNIVVTHMATGSFPFVRYQTGDVGVLSDEICACGRGLPILKDVVGRSSDFVVAQDGSKLHGAALTYVLRELDGIEAFKIVQKTPQLVQVKIVKGQDYLASNETHICSEFSKRLGENLQCEFDYPDQIDPEASGKYRYIISEVAIS